ncbi:hypothetical protein Tco_0243772, partial [Tanacetum coccineum]
FAFGFGSTTYMAPVVSEVVVTAAAADGWLPVAAWKCAIRGVQFIYEKIEAMKRQQRFEPEKMWMDS